VVVIFRLTEVMIMALRETGLIAIRVMINEITGAMMMVRAEVTVVREVDMIARVGIIEWYQRVT
jgi:hypothetical protein